MSYIIGSFNLRDFNFSNTSADGEEKLQRDFEKISQIIIKENFDVVALQEINAKYPLEYLVSVLNRSKNLLREYAYIFGENMPYATKDPERYGFIWNIRRLRLSQTKRNNNPSYYICAGGKGVIRPPYYARFTPNGLRGGLNFELRLINTHIKDASREEDRIREFDVLVRQILPRICDHQTDVEKSMPAYTFLLGDYNLALNKSERAIYKIKTITSSNYTGKWREYRTAQEEKTSLKLPNQQIEIADCYANNYDHFTYESSGEKGLDRKLVLIPQRVEALSKYFSEETSASQQLQEYRKTISDHVPIKMIVDLQKNSYEQEEQYV